MSVYRDPWNKVTRCYGNPCQPRTIFLSLRPPGSRGSRHVALSDNELSLAHRKRRQRSGAEETVKESFFGSTIGAGEQLEPLNWSCSRHLWEGQTNTQR
jgi:hypothetical protein